jgi:hypothetical protein
MARDRPGRSSIILFPNRTNVEFIRVLNRREIEVLFWERGVGETLSSGSCSSAAAVASTITMTVLWVISGKLFGIYLRSYSLIGSIYGPYAFILVLLVWIAALTYGGAYRTDRWWSVTKEWKALVRSSAFAMVLLVALVALAVGLE